MAVESPPSPPRSYRRTPAGTLAYTLALGSMAMVISGTRACQEDYDLAGQTNIVATPTSTTAPTLTATPTGSPSPTPTETPSVDESPTPEPEQEPLVGILDEATLESADGHAEDPAAEPRAAASQNWLGSAFVAKVGLDSDGDGFTDEAENEYLSDPHNAKVTPAYSCASLLRDRLAGADDDGDGLVNGDEQRRGTDAADGDSDGDGCADGAEVWSQSSPLDGTSLPASAAGHCLSDAFKGEKGLTVGVDDADSDGLVDSVELAIGSDPTSADSDGDGIYDGREVQIGCDPLRRDFLG
jgi:hypothetical protein